MSLLIKALQKAEQSKEAKNNDKQASPNGLELELAPQEPKAEPVTSQTASAAPGENPDVGLSLTQEVAIAGSATPAIAPSATMPVAETEPSLVDELGFTLADEAGFSDPPAAPKPAVEPKKPAPPPPTPQPVADSKPVATRSNEAPASQPKPIPAPDTQRMAAASLLSLQQDDRPASRTGNNRRSMILGGVALLLLLLLGGGFYYYLGTLDQNQFVATVPPAPSAPAQSASPPTVVATPAEPTSVAAEEEATQATTQDASTPVESKPVVTEDTPKADKIAQEEEAKPAPAAAQQPRKAAATSEDNPMKVARMRKSEPSTNATQVAAYQAFMSGDDQAAGRLYRQLLQSDSRNVDALLGLAAVAARQDKMDEAVKNYQRALELDPRNSLAQAGIISILGQSNPGEAESRLKQLIAQQPDAAYLHAALGNAYSESNRWPEAQQAYFQAFSMDAGNADYAFNLAVSLDQMAKYDLALDYYQKTAALLARQGGNVDSAALDSRIGQLRDLLRK